MLVHRRVGGWRFGGFPCLPCWRLDGEDLHSLAVQQQLHLVGFAEAFDVLVAVARESNLDLVLAVQREGVRDDGAAARAEGQSLEVLFLGEVSRKPDGVAAWRTACASDGQPADFLGRG